MNEVLLHCTECPFKTNSNRKLGRHTALAHANWKYRCPLCPFDSCYVASLYRHKKEVHQIGLNNQTDLQNFECPDDDEDPDDLEILSRAGDKAFTRSSPKTMNRPRRTSSRGSRGSSGSTTPQSCETPDLSKELLPCRIQRRYQCTTCDLQTRNPRDYLYHLRDVHGEKLKVYECSQCLYASRHQQKLQRHLSFGHSTKLRSVLPTVVTQSKHPVAKKTMTRPRSPTEQPFLAVVKAEITENEEPQYSVVDNEYSTAYQSDGYPEMFPPEAQDYHMNDLSFENTGANNYMENLYNVQLLEEPPEEEILEIIDGEVDEVMNMSSRDVGSPLEVNPNIDSPVAVNAIVGDLDLAVGSPDMGSVGSPEVVWKSDEVLEESTSASNDDHKCSKCAFKSKSKLIVQRHEKLKHMKRKAFRCVKCNYVTNVRGRYTKHMKYHDLPYIKCDMCDFKTPYRWNMDRHMKNHTTEGNHHCNQCSFAADTKQSLSFHTFNHHNDSGGTIQDGKDDIDCGRKTVLYSELNGLPATINNEKSVVPDGEFEEVASTEVENGKRRAPYVNLRAVAVRKSKFKRRFRCPICSFVATSRTGLYRHKAQHKADNFNKDNIGNKVIKSGFMNLENVIQQEGTEKPLKCKLCAYEAKWISEMVKHQRIHTHEKPFVCPFCGFRSRWKGDMTRHIQKYHKENKKIENSYSRPFLTTRKRRKIEEQEAFDRERNQANQEAEGPQFLRSQPSRFRKNLFSNTQESIHVSTENDQDKTSANLVISTNDNQTIDLEADDNMASKELTSELSTKQSEEEGKTSNRHALRVLRRHYRCPHCKFSAATASRFHVHIVAHFNKRPYMCSECGYRSNWQWDITKHIRLKIARQQTHYNAKLETLNEFGTRNYEKYIKYVVYDDSPIADEGPVNASDDLGEITMKLRPTYWKCKQCPYRSSSKRSMFYHLPKHYQNRPFFCGECGQASRWRENVERHCRLQHGNIIRMIENRDAVMVLEAQGSSDDIQMYDDMTDKEGFVRDTSSGKEALDDTLEGTKSETSTTDTLKVEDSVKVIDPDSSTLKRHACEICPYRTRKIHDMQVHMKMHQPQPGTIFKCMFCPFYTSLRRSLLQHMKLHVSKPHEYISNALESTPDQDDETDVTVNDINDDNLNEQTSSEHFTSTINQSRLTADVPVEPAITVSESDPVTNVKRYSCDHCPYTSDSKTQYLYHKQFHRNSRSCPFKCPHCNYAVTRGHLLMQHIRLHKNKSNLGIKIPTKLADLVEKPPVSSGSDSIHTKDNITIHANVPMQRKTGIPMVWVSKGSTNMVKMYKCRYCPHVNKRRSNIREHEKMHRKRRMTGRYSCSYCTYVCNNQGVLSNHIKVHQNTSQVLTPVGAVASPLVNNSQRECAPVVNTASAEPNETLYVTPLIKSTSTNPAQKVLFTCDICPERFTRSGDLRIHGKFHEADLPWKCTHCSYTAKHRSQLYRHMKVHSPNYIGRSSSAEVATEEASNQPMTANSRPASPRVTSPEKQSYAKPYVKSSGSENKHRCHLCPANFLKPSSLAYHLSLHGGTGKFKCPHCCYAVKNIGNLCRHTKVHDKARMKGIVAPPSGTGTAPSTTSFPQRDVSRRLECHKCPATFDKYTRYDVHIKLHGSQQRFTCDSCDYSVPFMANLMKHQKIHTLAANGTNELIETSSLEEVDVEKPISAEPSPKKVVQPEPQDLSLSEQQMLMLLQHQQQMAQQQQQGADAKRFFFCDYCPYQHPRKDAVFSHMKRHDASQETVCPHCDYGTSTHSQAFIREHVKLHFQKPKRHHIDSYWKCEQAEVWAAETCGTSTLLFKDKGEDVDEMNRFYYVGCETEPFIEEVVPDTVNSKLQVTICDIKEQKLDVDIAVSTISNTTDTEEKIMIVNGGNLMDDHNIICAKKTSYVKPIMYTKERNLTCNKITNHIEGVWDGNIGLIVKPSQDSENTVLSDVKFVCETLLQKVSESETGEQLGRIKVEKMVSTVDLKTQTDSLDFQTSMDVMEAILTKIDYENLKLDRLSMLEVACGDLDSEESSTKIEESDVNTDAKDSITSMGDVSSIELVLEESSTESVEMLPAESQEVKSEGLVLEKSLIKVWNSCANTVELLNSTTEAKDTEIKDQDMLIAELDNFSYGRSGLEELVIKTEKELNPEICSNVDDQVTSVKDLVTSELSNCLTEQNNKVISFDNDSKSDRVDNECSNDTEIENNDDGIEMQLELPNTLKEHSQIFAQLSDLNPTAELPDSKPVDSYLKGKGETDYSIMSASLGCLNTSIPVEDATNCLAESESHSSTAETSANTLITHNLMAEIESRAETTADTIITHNLIDIHGTERTTETAANTVNTNNLVDMTETESSEEVGANRIIAHDIIDIVEMESCLKDSATHADLAIKAESSESEVAAKSDLEAPRIETHNFKSEQLAVNNALLIETAEDSKTESDIVTESEELLVESYLPETIPVDGTNVCRDSVDNDDMCCEIVATINDENQLQIEIIGQ